MKISENLGTLFLGLWLSVTALLSLTNVYIPIVANLLPLFALVAGLLMLLGAAKLPKSLGMILLAVWLILKGLSPFLYVRIPYLGLLVDLLAVAAGALIILRR